MARIVIFPPFSVFTLTSHGLIYMYPTNIESQFLSTHSLWGNAFIKRPKNPLILKQCQFVRDRKTEWEWYMVCRDRWFGQPVFMWIFFVKFKAKCACLCWMTLIACVYCLINSHKNILHARPLAHLCLKHTVSQALQNALISNTHICTHTHAHIAVWNWVSSGEWALMLSTYALQNWSAYSCGWLSEWHTHTRRHAQIHASHK